MLRITPRGAAGVLISAALTAGATACEGLSSQPAAGGKIEVCVRAADGSVRFVSAGSRCRQGETSMQLTNGGAGSEGATGPQGPAGAQGPQGAQGPPGQDGAPGTNGTDGTDGTQGPQGPVGPSGPYDSYSGVKSANTTIVSVLVDPGAWLVNASLLDIGSTASSCSMQSSAAVNGAGELVSTSGRTFIGNAVFVNSSLSAEAVYVRCSGSFGGGAALSAVPVTPSLSQA